MKRTLILFGLFIFIIHSIFAQNIVIKDNIATIDGTEYIKVVKKNSNDYIIFDLVSDAEILQIKTKKVYNTILKKHSKLPNVFFIDLNKNVGFEAVDIKNKYDLVKFLYDYKLVFLNGAINTEWVIDFFKRRYEYLNTPFKQVNKNDYKNFEIKPVLTVTNNDSTYINKLIFNEVYSESYTQKVIYDQFGMWDNILKPDNEENFILVWEDIKLFKSKTELYTVAVSGYTNSGYRFASVIVFDSKNNDCLSDDSDIKESITSYFSNGIKSINSTTEFYEVYNKAKLDYKYN